MDRILSRVVCYTVKKHHSEVKNRKMRKIRIMPRKETMIIIYPFVAAYFIGLDPNLPAIVSIPMLISSIAALGWTLKLAVRKVLELKKVVGKRNGRY